MRERYRESHTHEDFIAGLEDAFDWCVQTQAPVRSMGSWKVELGHGQIQYGSALIPEVINIVQGRYNIGEALFDLLVNFRERLLGAGLLVEMMVYHTPQMTHQIIIPTKKNMPFAFRGSDDDALLLMLRHGGIKVRRLDTTQTLDD